jgi:hypothetical protein
MVPLGINAQLEPDNGSEGVWNSETDGVDLTTVVGVNNGGGSRIVLRDSRNQRLLASDASTPIPEREGGVTSECGPLPADGPDAYVPGSNIRR